MDGGDKDAVILVKQPYEKEKQKGYDQRWYHLYVWRMPDGIVSSKVMPG